MSPRYVALVGSAVKPFRGYVSERLDVGWVVLDFDGDKDRLGEAVAAVGMPNAAPWKSVMPRLRFLQLSGAGTDGLDPAALPDGCLVSNVYEHEASIAEYVFTSLFHLENGPWLAESMKAFRKGEWPHLDRIGRPPRPTLCGKRFAVLGYGHIGRQCAAAASAFGMTVAAFTRTKPTGSDADGPIFVDSVIELARGSDYLLVACPDTSATRGLIDARVLAALPPHAKLINVSRGPIVDEQALFEALSSRRIAGAVLDVWYQYPSPEQPIRHGSRLDFHTLENVVLTPHLSAHTRVTVERRWSFIAQNLNRFASGQPPLNPVAWSSAAGVAGRP